MPCMHDAEKPHFHPPAPHHIGYEPLRVLFGQRICHPQIPLAERHLHLEATCQNPPLERREFQSLLIFTLRVPGCGDEATQTVSAAAPEVSVFARLYQ
jgi:hypothetical protein